MEVHSVHCTPRHARQAWSYLSWLHGRALQGKATALEQQTPSGRLTVGGTGRGWLEGFLRPSQVPPLPPCCAEQRHKC